MAGDWIKMRSSLFTHPKVVRMASALNADRLRTVGGLMSAWCLFDAHSIDGHLSGYSLSALDELVGWTGFSAAMEAVEWLIVDGNGMSLPSFDTHNGASAKRRAQESDRKREARKTSAPDADKLRTREEKRREEKKDQKLSPPTVVGAGRFEEFWAAYPNKTGRKPCLAKWKSRKLDGHADEILADVKAKASGDRRWLDGFVPNPETYLNQDRWLDPVQGRRAAVSGGEFPDFMRGAV